MWWQDRLPALLSLSFVLGLLSVPRPYHQVHVPAPLPAAPQSSASPVYTLYVQGDQHKSLRSSIYSSSVSTEKKWGGERGGGDVEQVCSFLWFIELFKCTLTDCTVQIKLLLFTGSFEAKSLTPEATRGANRSNNKEESWHVQPAEIWQLRQLFFHVREKKKKKKGNTEKSEHPCSHRIGVFIVAPPKTLGPTIIPNMTKSSLRQCLLFPFLRTPQHETAPIL